MSLDWYPGQRVVCVDDNFDTSRHDHNLVRLPKKGQVLTIRTAEIQPNTDLFSLTFVEIKNPVLQYSNGLLERAFRVKHFRPLQENRLDQFRKHLVKKPERQDA